ncbi:MAG: Crp/Fnr family transcriptional regulator [Bacteroidota bacterium]
MQPTQLILANINKRIRLEIEEEQYFLSLLETFQISKKAYLLKQANWCNKIFFVNQGLLRSYSIGQAGKEATVMFAFQDWWITDMYAFVKRTPALTNIQAIEQSEGFYLSKKSLEQLYIEIPKFEKFFRILMQNAYIREQYRVWENISLTAEERYISFLKKYPQIEQKAPQKYIASYLGITPEFLSAMKKRR